MFLLSLAIETITGFIATLPMMALFHVVLIKQCKQNKIKVSMPHFMGTYVFCLVLVAILSATGIPSITNLRVHISINLIPFIDILSNFIQYIQNIILFIPLGFFLPMLWHKFESKSLTFITGLLLSFAIETIQLFSLRATDIDDLIMNTLGTIVGYFLFIKIKRLFPKIEIFSNGNNAGYLKWEVYFCFAFTWLAMFFIQSFISNWIWTFIL